MLTPEQRLKLKTAGYSDTKINVFEARKAIREQEAQAQEPSLLGKVARETLRPFANVATSVAQAAHVVTGGEGKVQPFSGEFLGEVPGLGKIDITKSPLDPENLKTIKKSVKAGTDIGLTLAGGGGAAGVAKTGIKEGVIQAAKTGAKTGSIIGGVSGASTGLEEGATLGSTVKNTVIGAGTGAAVGGVVGGVSGGVSNTVTAAKKVPGALASKGEKVVSKITGRPTNETDFALNLVSPKATDKIKQEAIAQGRVTEQGVFRPSKILPSKRDATLAESVKGVVSMKKTNLQNVDALDSAVGKINEGVKSYVKENKVPFNTNQLRTQLNKGKSELKIIFASDKQAEKTYNAVVKEFIKHVKSKDTAGLLDARQAFDKIPSIRKLLDSQGLGENVKKEIVLTSRLKANQYIASLLPKGNKYRADLLRESHMLEVIGNIADKNTKEIGVNKIQALTAKYPILKLIAGTAVGAGGVGVGGAIIGSSD